MKAISWRYTDGSASGVVGIYGDKSADEVLRLLAEHGDPVKEFVVAPVRDICYVEDRS